MTFHDQPDPTSPPQKAFAVTGTVLAAIGFLLFFSTFFSAAMNFGDFTNYESQTRSMACRAVTGMFLMIVGGVIHGVARRKGGSGDNQSNDGSLNSNLSGPIKIRCQKCSALNDEAARFCDQCGGSL